MLNRQVKQRIRTNRHRRDRFMGAGDMACYRRMARNAAGPFSFIHAGKFIDWCQPATPEERAQGGRDRFWISHRIPKGWAQTEIPEGGPFPHGLYVHPIGERPWETHAQ